MRYIYIFKNIYLFVELLIYLLYIIYNDHIIAYPIVSQVYHHKVIRSEKSLTY